MASTTAAAAKRPYLKQSDVPAASLDEALRVPQGIFVHYAEKPASPLQVAKALDIDPKGSQLRVISGAAIAFGLIDGGAQATSMTVPDLARRILRPKKEGSELTAKREAVLNPRIFGEFLKQYDGNAFPRQDIALNVLADLGVPREKAGEVLDRIDASARSVRISRTTHCRHAANLKANNRFQRSALRAATEPERWAHMTTVGATLSERRLRAST